MMLFHVITVFLPEQSLKAALTALSPGQPVYGAVDALSSELASGLGRTPAVAPS